MKRLWMLFLLTLLLLSACSNSEETTGNQENPAETETDQEETVESEEENPEAVKEGEEVEEKAQPSEPHYEINRDSWSLTPMVESANEEVVLLTIDDAPDTYAVEMANTLKENNAKAIFFVNGHFLDTDEEKEMLKEIHDLGFPIGNHTFSHAKLPELTKEEQREEILELNDHIEGIIGERPRFFRAPHGMNTAYANQVAEEEGMLVMNWTYGYDYFEPYKDAEKLEQAMVSGEGPEVDVPYSLLQPGAILLMHDREWTAEALADIVGGLREEGYEIADPEEVSID
ncbi:polysaccharide deacetylase family protein [Virgibacillus xinjiangensis]|uniref:Polysaccharide deacetylase family protein n=1 Tax=Virgibacillus xinjiangensis TaxID=393090 RepID=A0ABV7CV31_9BACI